MDARSIRETAVKAKLNKMKLQQVKKCSPREGLSNISAEALQTQYSVYGSLLAMSV